MVENWEFYRRYMEEGLSALPPLQQGEPLYDFSGPLSQKLRVIVTEALPDMLCKPSRFLHRSKLPAPWPREILALCQPGAKDAPLPPGYAYEVIIPQDAAT